MASKSNVVNKLASANLTRGGLSIVNWNRREATSAWAGENGAVWGYELLLHRCVQLR